MYVCSPKLIRRCSNVITLPIEFGLQVCNYVISNPKIKKQKKIQNTKYKMLNKNNNNNTINTETQNLKEK